MTASGHSPAGSVRVVNEESTVEMFLPVRPLDPNF